MMLAVTGSCLPGSEVTVRPGWGQRSHSLAVSPAWSRPAAVHTEPLNDNIILVVVVVFMSGSR